MKKYLFIFLIVIILLAGCISNNNEKDNNEYNFPKENEISIIISMKKSQFSINESNLILNVILKNNGNSSIHIEKNYMEDTNIFAIFNNNTIIPQRTSDDLEEISYIEIRCKENISFNFNLSGFNEWYFKSTGDKFNTFPQKGDYSIYTTYNLPEKGYIKSNQIKFNII